MRKARLDEAWSILLCWEVSLPGAGLDFGEFMVPSSPEQSGILWSGGAVCSEVAFPWIPCGTLAQLLLRDGRYESQDSICSSSHLPALPLPVTIPSPVNHLQPFSNPPQAEIRKMSAGFLWCFQNSQWFTALGAVVLHRQGLISVHTEWFGLQAKKDIYWWWCHWVVLSIVWWSGEVLLPFQKEFLPWKGG